jgi:hypothetical protein
MLIFKIRPKSHVLPLAVTISIVEINIEGYVVRRKGLESCVCMLFSILAVSLIAFVIKC